MLNGNTVDEKLPSDWIDFVIIQRVIKIKTFLKLFEIFLYSITYHKTSFEKACKSLKKIEITCNLMAENNIKTLDSHLMSWRFCIK